MRLRFVILALLGLGCGVAGADEVPLPQPRPAIWTEPHSFAEAIAGLGFDPGDVGSEPTLCDGRLAAMAAIELLPRFIGPGACGGRDMVEVDAVFLPKGGRIAVEPAAVLNCSMAESVASGYATRLPHASPSSAAPSPQSRITITTNAAGAIACPAPSLVSTPMARPSTCAPSHLADGRRLALSDTTVDKPLRDALRDSACRRFTTVLGPGADIYHSGHVHLDVVKRRAGYRICQWDVREPLPGGAHIPLPRPRPATLAAILRAKARDGIRLPFIVPA